MERKEFLNKLTWIWGGVLLIPSSLLKSCTYKPVRRIKLTEKDIPFLDAIVETIIPSTADSRGAKKAKVGTFLLVMVRDCVSTEQQLILLDGLNTLDEHCAKTYEKSFMDLGATKQLEIMQQLQSEAIAHDLEERGKAEPLPHYFDLLKKLTIQGYFTSKIGCTRARRYNPIPGIFEACILYKKEDRIWAT